MSLTFKTADICDTYSDSLQIAEPMFSDFGGKLAFYGTIRTVKCHEDNSHVRAMLETEGNNQVLVVDGGGSLRCALLGDQLATLAANNHWAGLIIYGCIRDSAEIAGINIGVKALTTHPLKSMKRGEGERDVTVNFAGVSFIPGEVVYCDDDGIIISAKSLFD